MLMLMKGSWREEIPVKTVKRIEGFDSPNKPRQGTDAEKEQKQTVGQGACWKSNHGIRIF